MHDHLARQVGLQRLAAGRRAARFRCGVWLGALGGGCDLFGAIRLEVFELQFELVDIAVQPLGAGLAELVALSRATLANLRHNVAVAVSLKLVFLGTMLAGVTGLWPAILADTGATVLVVTLKALWLLRWQFTAEEVR